MYKFDNPNYVPTMSSYGPDIPMLLLDIFKSADRVLENRNRKTKTNSFSNYFNKK